MGIIAKFPTSKPHSLKQIEERLALKRHQEDILDPDLISQISTKQSRPNASVYNVEIIRGVVSPNCIKFLKCVLND